MASGFAVLSDVVRDAVSAVVSGVVSNVTGKGRGGGGVVSGTGVDLAAGFASPFPEGFELDGESIFVFVLSLESDVAPDLESCFAVVAAEAVRFSAYAGS